MNEMKTPTILVRLAGFYLLTTCSIRLFELYQMQAAVGRAGAMQNQLAGNYQLLFTLGLIAGLGTTLFAGPLARIFTFDSESRKGRDDLSDQLLGR